MLRPWRELESLYNPELPLRRCRSSTGTYLAVSDFEDSSGEEEEEDEEEERVKYNGPSAAVADLLRLHTPPKRHHFKKQSKSVGNGGDTRNLNIGFDLRENKNEYFIAEETDYFTNGFEEITDIQGTEEADGKERVTFQSSNEVEERAMSDEEELEINGRRVAMDGGRDAAAEKLSSSPYFSQRLTGGFSMSSFKASGAVRPTKLITNGASVAASRVIASSSTTVSVVSNGIEESGIFENNSTNNVAAGDQSTNTGPPIRRKSPKSPQTALLYQKQTSIITSTVTGLTSNADGLGARHRLMRPESREITSCLDLASKTRQEEEKKTQKKKLATLMETEKKFQTLPLQKSKSTELHKAKSIKNLRKILTNPEIDPNATDHHLDTPLHTFVRRSKYDLLVALLTSRKGVRIDERDGDSNTPLHIAARKGEKLIIKTLIAFGADLSALDAHNQTPIDLAKGKIKEKIKSFAVKPKIMSPARPRGFSAISQILPCAPEMIGFYLSWRREARLCLDMEKEITRMLKEEEHNDISQAAAGFMQLGDVYKWRKTRVGQAAPGNSILFLDGGGMRGLMSIEILMDIEERTGERIIDLFDWIVGTSTGGIIALALVYGHMTLSDIRDMYIKMAPDVFGGSFFQAGNRSEAMEKVMMEIFKDTKMKDIREPKVMISAVNMENLEVEFFDNFCHDDVPVWMAARATSAAPMYFLSFNGYVDGGVKANNPSEFAMSRIRDYHESRSMEQPHFSVAVSVGTGHIHNPKRRVSGNLNPASLFTPKNMLDLLLNAISGSEEVSRKFANQCKEVGTKYYRFNPFLEQEINANETDSKKLVKLINKAKLYLLEQDVLALLHQMCYTFQELDFLGETVTDFL